MGTLWLERGKKQFTLSREGSHQKLRGGMERQISRYLLHLLSDREHGGIFLWVRNRDFVNITFTTPALLGPKTTGCISFPHPQLPTYHSDSWTALTCYPRGGPGNLHLSSCSVIVSPWSALLSSRNRAQR